jgi:hypothetical protein
MQTTQPFRRAGLWLVLFLLSFSASAQEASTQDASTQNNWRPVGLMRIRDMTPFGIVRLDLLPAHAVPANPGTFAFEVNVSYQNTYALSENVSRYLENRDKDGARLSQEDIQAILALPGDAYILDGELGLADLTLHYRVSDHIGVYGTLPYYSFAGGFLDGTIESFHDNFGFNTAGREFVERNRFFILAKIGDTRLLVLDEPQEDELGDPVFGVRYSLFETPKKWNLIVEGAAKVALGSDQRLVSSGTNDYGLQATLQRFFKKQALYASVSAVNFRNPDEVFETIEIVPTVLLGYEFKLTRHTNGILQFYASPSVFEESTVPELTDEKYLLTLGFQTRRRNTVYRFGITENISNFSVTPDIGVTLSIAQILPGRR